MKASADTTKSKSSILSLVRAGPVSIPDLVAETGLSVNAVRFHIESLEADGLVESVGTRAPSGPGKPAALYGVTAEADLAFSRAYAPVLAACIAELRSSAPAKEVARFLQNVGRRLGADAGIKSKPLSGRVRAASDFLNEIGGLTTVVRKGSDFEIVGRGCPLSAVVEREPCACQAVEALVSEIVGRKATERCDRTGRPSCRFEVSAA